MKKVLKKLLKIHFFFYFNTVRYDEISQEDNME